MGTNFVTSDVALARNVSLYDFEAFWSTIPQREMEKKSTNYFNDINERTKCCLQSVEGVRYAYMVKTEVFPESNYRKLFENATLSKQNVSTFDLNGLADSIFSFNMKNSSIAMHVLNDYTYGQLVNTKDVPEDKIHTELTRIFENHDLWERRYILEAVRKTTTKDPTQMPEILPKDTIQSM